MSRIAIESYLVDDLPATAPPGFAVLQTAVDSMPHELALADGWSVILYAPTGIAREWLDGDPAAVVSSSRLESVPHAAPGDEAARAAPRLVIRRGGALLGALPLAAGVIGTFHTPSAMLEIVAVSWEIRAGAMRGGSPGSARIELAFRSRVVPAGVLTGGTARGSGSGGPAASASRAGNTPDDNLG